MVTSQLKGKTHYYLNGDWFFKEESAYETSDEIQQIYAVKTASWKRGTCLKISGSGECHKYEEMILNQYVLYEEMKTLRKKMDCSELSNAIRHMKESIMWMENVLAKFNPPGIE